MPEPILKTERLVLRNWDATDQPLFHRINSDEQVMKFFPFRRSREEADAIMDEVSAHIETRGYGFAAVALRETGKPIGFCGLNPWSLPPLFPPGSVEIGWRLAPEFWGKGYASEAARAWLAHGFSDLGLEEIVSFAVTENTPSLAVMARIGMQRDPARDFDHPQVPESHPHLVHHLSYSLTAAQHRKIRLSPSTSAPAD